MLGWLLNLGFAGSPAAPTPDLAESVIALIYEQGISVESVMTSNGVSVLSAIAPSLGVLSLIYESGVSVSSPIDETGESVDVEL